jgi:methionyl-tRNA formyltransferase
MVKIPVVFFGNEKLATGLPSAKPFIRNAIVDAGFEIEQIVTGKLSDLGNHKAKIAVLAAYGRIIPQSVLDQFPLGIINVHPSLLPYYRGPTPIEQAMLDGATKTGVSIMRLTAGMDEGPIYRQKSIQLSGSESKAELTDRLQQLGAELISEVLPAIAAGELQPRSQPHPDRATYSRKLTKNDGEINWSKPADKLEREVRTFLEWPKSHARLADVDVIITSAKVTTTSDSGSPGDVKIEQKRLMVQTGQDWLEILNLQVPGKKEMTAEAFLAGYSYKLQ